MYENIERKKLGKVFIAPIVEKGIEGAPDIVIEIISPSTAYYDLIEKKEVYEKYGQKHLRFT